MKNLKYLETRDSKHFYQHNQTAIPVNAIVASLYSDEQSRDTSLCWLIRSDTIIAPVELWKGIKGTDTRQPLLDDSRQPEIELLINSAGGAQTYNEHPVIKNLKGIADHWGKSIPTGKIADSLNALALEQCLEYLEFQNQIDWSLYKEAEKAKELISRGDITRSEAAALAQGLIYLAGELPKGDDVGILASIKYPGQRASRRRRGGVRVGGRNYYRRMR